MSGVRAARNGYRVGVAVRLAVAAVCALVVSSGAMAGTRRPASCPAHEGGAWMAVLGRASSPTTALALQRRALRVGFRQSVIVQDGPRAFKVVLFGLPSRAAAVGVGAEAKRAGFRVFAEANVGPCSDQVGNWEAVFGHTTSMGAARALLKRINTVGFKPGSLIETDGPRDYEVAVNGILSTSQFAGFAAEARRVHFIVAFEPS